MKHLFFYTIIKVKRTITTRYSGILARVYSIQKRSTLHKTHAVVLRLQVRYFPVLFEMKNIVHNFTEK